MGLVPRTAAWKSSWRGRQSVIRSGYGLVISELTWQKFWLWHQKHVFFLFRRSKLQTESLIAVKFTQCLHKKSLGSCPSHNKDATFAVKLCVYIYSLSVCLSVSVSGLLRRAPPASGWGRRILHIIIHLYHIMCTVCIYKERDRFIIATFP